MYLLSAIWVGLELSGCQLFNGAFLQEKKRKPYAVKLVVMAWLIMSIYANIPINNLVKQIITILIFTFISILFYNGKSIVHFFLTIICYIFTQHFPLLLEKHGLRKIRFHDLRHSCASLLHANGVSMKEIQVWLGHSDISTTMNIYTHLDVDSKVASANAIIGIFPGEKKCPSVDAPAEEAHFDESAEKKRKRKSA